MKNVYINQYLRSLQKFFESQQTAISLMKANSSTYLPSVAERYNAQEKDKQQEAYALCQQEIYSTYENVRSLLAKATKPDPEWLNESDIRLFNSGINLTPEVIADFVEKYRSENNFTMLMWFRDWLSKQPQSLALASIEFYLPADFLDVYRQFGNIALRNAAKIAAPNSPIMTDPLELRTFADEAIHGKAFEIIGDGRGLATYESAKVSDRILHSFDNVKLQNTDVNSIILQYAL